MEPLREPRGRDVHVVSSVGGTQAREPSRPAIAAATRALFCINRTAGGRFFVWAHLGSPGRTYRFLERFLLVKRGA
jgi:hypothetical protein